MVKVTRNQHGTPDIGMTRLKDRQLRIVYKLLIKLYHWQIAMLRLKEKKCINFKDQKIEKERMVSLKTSIVQAANPTSKYSEAYKKTVIKPISLMKEIVIKENGCIQRTKQIIRNKSGKELIINVKLTRLPNSISAYVWPSLVRITMP